VPLTCDFLRLAASACNIRAITASYTNEEWGSACQLLTATGGRPASRPWSTRRPVLDRWAVTDWGSWKGLCVRPWHGPERR
jgi:hypothetical protein